MNRFRTIALTAVAGLALVACGPAASSSSIGPSSEPSVAPSEALASAGGGVLPSFTAGAVGDLEALIPDRVGNLTMTKQSMQGSDYLVSGTADAASKKFIEDLGVAPSDISIAVGYGFSTDASAPPMSLIMVIFRAAGADTNKLVSGMKESMDASRDTPLTWSSATVGGKSVEVAVEADATVYLYAKDDILIFVSGDQASAEEALSGLP